MVNLTPTAAEKLSGIMSQKGMVESHALRVFVKGGGFHIDNPQATSSCGCGSSFRTSKTHDGQEVAEKSCGH